MTWQERLQQIGFAEENAPNMIKKAIRDLRTFEKNKAAAEAEIQRPNISEKKKEQAEEMIETYSDAINAQADVIIKKIDQWDRNKDKYAALGEKLKASQQAKKGGASSAPAAAQQSNPAPAAQQAASGGQTDPPAAEKKSGVATFILVGLLGVLSFGAYNYLKNDR